MKDRQSPATYDLAPAEEGATCEWHFDECNLYDQDGIDSPWNRTMDRAIRDDARAASLAWLRARIKPGDVILTAVLHRSRSGMERVVGCWALNIPERAALRGALDAFDLDGPRSASATVLTTGRTALTAGEISPRIVALFGHVARVLGRKADTKRGGVVFRGSGERQTARLVHDLGVALYGDGNALVCEEL